MSKIIKHWEKTSPWGNYLDPVQSHKVDDYKLAEKRKRLLGYKEALVIPKILENGDTSYIYRSFSNTALRKKYADKHQII